MIAVHNVYAVGFEAGNRTDNRTGGDNDVFGFERLFLAFSISDFNFAGQREFAGAFEDSDLVFLHQILDALRVFQHHLVFSLLHVGKSELNPGRLDAKISGMLHLFVNMRGHQHLLGGNAATQRTRASKPVIFLDYGSLKAQLAGANGGHVTTRPTADNRYIKLFVSQFSRFPLVRAVMLTVKDRAL